MKMLQKLFSLTMVFCCLSFMSLHLSGFDACAGVNPLKTEPATAAEIKGNFSVILYRGSYADDLETVALLDSEGDQFTFEPFAPDFDYVKDLRLVIPACFALACRQALLGPGYGLAGIQPHDQRQSPMISMDARHAQRASAAPRRARRQHSGTLAPTACSAV